MEERQRILVMIYEAIDRICEGQNPAPELKKSADTVLIGSSAKLDSLGFVNLAIALEERIQEVFGLEISVVDLAAGIEQDAITADSLAGLISAYMAQNETSCTTPRPT